MALVVMLMLWGGQWVRVSVFLLVSWCHPCQLGQLSGYWQVHL